jgi:hypothetical protein
MTRLRRRLRKWWYQGMYRRALMELALYCTAQSYPREAMPRHMRGHDLPYFLEKVRERFMQLVIAGYSVPEDCQQVQDFLRSHRGVDV